MDELRYVALPGDPVGVGIPVVTAAGPLTVGEILRADAKDRCPCMQPSVRGRSERPAPKEYGEMHWPAFRRSGPHS